jgi:transcriptional regulator with XRE-family HTH domain
LAKLVGVTPSTISQVESNQIYPSLPALIKMAEILSVDVTSFFQGEKTAARRAVFPASEAVDIQFQNLPKGSITGRLMTPIDSDFRAEPYIIEIPPNKTLPAHFFMHKGEEAGYLISGQLQLKLEKATHSVKAGDTVYLTSEMPSQWKNPGKKPAKLLWIKIK